MTDKLQLAAEFFFELILGSLRYGVDAWDTTRNNQTRKTLSFEVRFSPETGSGYHLLDSLLYITPFQFYD